MVDYNRVILSGNLTRDPETRYTPAGTQVTHFGMAINRKYRQGDEQKEETCFVDITTFARQAELVAQYLSKGRGVLIEGRLQFRAWEDQSGQRRSKLDVVADMVKFLPGRGGGDGGSGGGGSPAAHAQAGGGMPPDSEIPPPGDDDIPFIHADTSLHGPSAAPFGA